MPSRNATQLAGFAEQGYLLLEDLLPDEAFGPLIADIEEGIERGARESLEEGRIRQTFDGESFIRRFASIEKEVGGGSKAGRHVLGKNLKTAGMFGLMTHPVLLDLVESMIGPEILSHPQFNCQAKMPGEEISKQHLAPGPGIPGCGGRRDAHGERLDSPRRRDEGERLPGGDSGKP